MRDVLGILGAIFISILLLSSVIQWLSDGFSTSKLSDVQSNLIMMQIKVQNLFSGSSSYADLDNDLLLNNEIVPASLSKGGVRDHICPGGQRFGVQHHADECSPERMREHGGLPARCVARRHNQRNGNRVRGCRGSNQCLQRRQQYRCLHDQVMPCRLPLKSFPICCCFPKPVI